MDSGETLKDHLEKLRRLRGNGATVPPRLEALKAFQGERLARTYADLARQPRYRKATRFFLEDLYGPKDFSRRDAAMLRIQPLMARTLPASAVQTATRAIELEALSEELDQRVAAALEPGPIDEDRYAEAYRVESTRAERERQIALIVAVGQDLDALVRKPLVLRTLRLMRTPARLAGLQDLQDFLERGFDAFSTMQGSAEFLAAIRDREMEILNRLFSGAAKPFSA